jgi:hypothetical protein
MGWVCTWKGEAGGSAAAVANGWQKSENMESYSMADQTMVAPPSEAVVQFSVFTPNRLGRLHTLINLLGSQSVHVLALTVLDTTESAIIRIVVDDPDRARRLLQQQGFSYAENTLLVTEINSTEDINRLLAALLEAELNVNYFYSFIPHPRGKSILAMSVEDNELAAQALKRHEFPLLKQADISR